MKRNQPGATIGGPIVPNRMFFFGGCQSTIQFNQPTMRVLLSDWRLALMYRIS